MNKWKKITGVEGLYKNANGKYYVRLTKPKDTFRSLRTETLREAKQAIRNLKESYDSGLDEINSENLKSLNEFIQAFLDHGLNELKISKKTKGGIRQALLSIRKVEALSLSNIKTLSSKKINRGIDCIPKLSNASKNYCVYAIRKVIEFAEQNNLIKEGDFVGIKSFSVSPRKIELPSDQQFRKLVECLKFPEERDDKKVQLPESWEELSIQELECKMNVSKSTVKRRIAEVKSGIYYKRKGRPEIAYSFLFLCYTGMRLGEARKLTWEDVQDDRIIIRGTKSFSSFRFLPIYPQLKALLNSISRFRGTVLETDKVLGRHRIDKALRRACTKVGIPYLRHHDLRHYFATKAVQSGVDLPTIARWLGHADGGVLAMKVYSNVMDEHAIKKSEMLQFASCD